MNESIKATYNDKINLLDLVRQYEYKIFQKFISNYDSVIDIGSGDGVMVKQFLKDFKQVIAIDKDSNIVKDTLETILHSNLKIVHASLDDESVTPYLKKVENIFLGRILENLDNPVKSLINLKNRMENPDTILYVSVSNAKSLDRLMNLEMSLIPSLYFLSEQDKTLGQQRWYDLSRLRADLDKAGFEIIESGGLLLKPLSNYQTSQYYSKEMVHASLKLRLMFPEYCNEIYCVTRKKI